MRISPLALGLAACLATSAGAAEQGPYVVSLSLKDHRFSPERVSAPAGQRIRIELVNLDGATEEFDSVDLHVERDVTPHGRVSFEVGPLAPGSYAFMGELHAETAAGKLVATPPK